MKMVRMQAVALIDGFHQTFALRAKCYARDRRLASLKGAIGLIPPEMKSTVRHWQSPC
jgi:hypothetical protein